MLKLGYSNFMARFVLIVSLLAVALATTYLYDGKDINQILSAESTLQSYHKCFMDSGSCTTDGTNIKKNLTEAFKNDCLNCTERIRFGLTKILRFLLENKPHLFADLEGKYDPSARYRKRNTMVSENV